jgi:hypothetical protein
MAGRTINSRNLRNLRSGDITIPDSRENPILTIGYCSEANFATIHIEDISGLLLAHPKPVE